MRKILIVFLICLVSFSCHALNYSALDARAKRISSDHAQTKEQLVSKLTQGLTSDADKARVLASWIAYQIDRNGYEHDKLIQASNDNKLADYPLPNDAFKTRVGTPQEFAQLFAELASLAGLQAVVIDGYAGRNIPSSRYSDKTLRALEPVINRIQGGNYRLQRYEASWNAVKIKDEWKLLDPYWMVQGERMFGRGQSTRSFANDLKKRTQKTPSTSSLIRGKNIDDDYFFTKPRDFIKTHFPYDEKWQLLPIPKTWSSFTN